MSATYRRTAATMSTEVGDDVVALQADRGFAYGMEQVTASVWKLLEQPRDLDALVGALTAEYEVDEDECRHEVGALLERMTAEGLVEQVQ
ncbi:PqqD family protein [Sphingomonas sp. LHG3443-2]|uniref:PqqD family protein n=1 Tax=Sphingomonas sp. LHG3443-2 TaxID=2804639 RepID=UPI003CF3626C